MLIVSIFINALAHPWFAFSDDILQMFAARILAGLVAGNTGVIQAIIADCMGGLIGRVIWDCLARQ